MEPILIYNVITKLKYLTTGFCRYVVVPSSAYVFLILWNMIRPLVFHQLADLDDSSLG